ncbi:MAG: methyltransferase domain-containing protein [Sphingobium sp.]|nr:methyltransferase domain-containing protein [Sphingobium sp.]
MITFQRVAKAAGKYLSKGALAVRAGLGAPRRFDCPACGRAVVGFFRYGDCAQWGCVACGASPRERLVNYLLQTGVLSVPQGAAFLHMAPNEGSLVRAFSAASNDYVPADLDPQRYGVPGMVRVDLMSLNDDARFDRIYASHVMEHVPDDHAVLANLFRALKPGGEAWLLVPLWDRPTEDGSFDIPPRERERRFGQWDHVRQYGADFADRIRAAGFVLEELRAADVDPSSRARMALDDVIFRATRPL